MTQVKFFEASRSLGILESNINTFLKDQSDKIEVKDVKYMALVKDDRGGRYITAMVIYEIKD